jgi:hypothetical protein
MTDEFRTSFLTYYVQSLGERTRDEKGKTKIGFDWIIYNLALAEKWIPHRLPFLRSGGDEISTVKTEAEFGIDLAFVSPDNETLRIFVLKDEVLNNANWTRHGFDTDLRNASAADMSSPELRNIKHVEVILAYNKDENHTGIELFNRRVAAQGTRVGDNISLKFERWNLTEIVERVKSTLLNPSLLPQKYFSHLSYICAQFGDFRHGSDEWTNQLIPNWRSFLESLLQENADERCVRMLPVALLILREQGKANPTVETGWIDLIEWGMLAAWRVVQIAPERNRVGEAVWHMWYTFYLADVERYYRLHAADLGVPYSLDIRMSGSFVDTIASAVIAQWHLTRLGILGIAYNEGLSTGTAEYARHHEEMTILVTNWLAGTLEANPSAMRPLIDLDHSALFVTWCCFWHAGRCPDIANWFRSLCNRLTMRRSGLAELPFIEGGNSLELVFECVARGEKPDEFCDTSSVYLVCLMEMICGLPESDCHRLLENVHHRLVLGCTDGGTRIANCVPINLMSWIPPEEWGDLVLTQSLSDKGECSAVEIGSSDDTTLPTGPEIACGLTTLVHETRSKRAFTWPDELPMAVILLACTKHRSPLPPEFWRSVVFPPTTEPQDE